jgi:KaiC/GvpD/RAD55 family RecA-like ATPase
MSRNPLKLPPWKLALSQGFYPAGTRNNALMVIASTLKNKGFDAQQTYFNLKSMNEKQADRFDQEKYTKDQIWKEVIEVVYGPHWNGGMYSYENAPEELKSFLRGLSIDDTTDANSDPSLVEQVSQGFGDFVDYANKIDEYTMQFGIPSLDNKLKIRKGHLIYLLSPPGGGKTSFAITLLNNMSRSGTHCYFASYDMYKHNVYQKLIQRHTRLSEEDLYNVFRNKEVEKIKGFKTILEKHYGNVTFCFRSGQSISEMKSTIREAEERTGKNIDLVVVDYHELVQTKSSDPTVASAEVAQGLREIANEGRVVVGLLQPNKMSSKPNEPLTSYNAAKGSSAIAQSATAILTSHRPGLDSTNNNENDNFFCINCVKNRNGSLFALDFHWDGPTQTIRELEDCEKGELKELRDKLKEKEILSNSGGHLI